MTHPIILPSWAFIYLILVLIAFISSFFTERGRARSFHRTTGSLMSLFSICSLVVALFNVEIAQFLGFFLLPITAIGIYWEYSRAERETVTAKRQLSEELDLSDEEREFMLNVALGLNALVVVPGYVAGLILCFNMLTNFA